MKELKFLLSSFWPFWAKRTSRIAASSLRVQGLWQSFDTSYWIKSGINTILVYVFCRFSRKPYQELSRYETFKVHCSCSHNLLRDFYSISWTETEKQFAPVRWDVFNVTISTNIIQRTLSRKEKKRELETNLPLANIINSNPFNHTLSLSDNNFVFTDKLVVASTAKDLHTFESVCW